MTKKTRIALTWWATWWHIFPLLSTYNYFKDDENLEFFWVWEEEWLEYQIALENDIPVALGNDVGCPWVSQYDFWRELFYFTKYVGVTNKFALYTATLRNAQLGGIGDITGSIETGKSADLIVTEGNPLDDLNTLRNVKMVMYQGKLLREPKVKRKQIVDENLDPFMVY